MSKENIIEKLVARSKGKDNELKQGLKHFREVEAEKQRKLAEKEREIVQEEKQRATTHLMVRATEQRDSVIPEDYGQVTPGRQYEIEALRLYSIGHSVADIACKLGLTEEVVAMRLNQAVQTVVHNFSMPAPRELFARYAMFQLDIIDELNEAKKKYIDTDRAPLRSLTALGRLKSDLMDKVMDRGSMLGIIARREDSSTNHLTQEQMLEQLKRQGAVINSLVRDIESKQIAETAPEVEDKPVN